MMKSSFEADTFWDIACATAAEDESIVDALAWLLESDTQDQMVLRDCYDGLDQYVIFKFGVEPEMTEIVYEYCKRKILAREVVYAEA